MKYRLSLFNSLVLIAVILGSVLVNSVTVNALSGNQFNPSNIIDDEVFYYGKSMSKSGIQNFLNSKMPSCDTNGDQTRSYYYNSSTGEVNVNGSWVTTSRSVYGQRYANFWNTHTTDSTGRKRSASYVQNQSVAPFVCLRDYAIDTPQRNAESGICGYLSAKTNRSAAGIIADVGVACGISPKVMLVLLQKEQGLLTDSWPWKNQYRIATGYGCPDTAPCNSEYYGFFNQVYKAAWQYKKYRANPTNYNYIAGQNNKINYNPNSSCGYKWVVIKNQATAGLYNYTPYVPNKAALDNLYGTGNNCSAYGNRNFWRYYNDWFGPTTQDYSYKFERLVGASPSVLSSSSTSLGNYTAAVTAGQKIYSFYFDDVNKTLNYALWDGSQWTDHLLDGMGATTAGATSNNVGRGITVTKYNGKLQLFYYDTTAGDLRHAWTNKGKWRIEKLDGTLSSVSGFDGDVGKNPAVTLYGDRGIQLLYYDATNGDLRHAWWTGKQWKFETLDGSASSVSGFNADVGNSQNPAITQYGKEGLQCIYYDATNGDLRHAWWTGKQWKFEALDGSASSVIGNDGDFGSNTNTISLSDRIIVHYYDRDNKAWRQAYYKHGWYGLSVDGSAGSMANSTAKVGGQFSITIYNNESLQLFYKDSSGGLTHSWGNHR